MKMKCFQAECFISSRGYGIHQNIHLELFAADEESAELEVNYILNTSINLGFTYDITRIVEVAE